MAVTDFHLPMSSIDFAKTRRGENLCSCHSAGDIEEELASMDFLFFGAASAEPVFEGEEENGPPWYSTRFKLREVLKGSLGPADRAHSPASRGCVRTQVHGGYRDALEWLFGT